jgi:hypothetical protein
MPIKQLTPKGRAAQALAEYMQRISTVVMRNLRYLGEQCVTEARRHHSYKDQTGNLTSSIGYVIAVNGRVVSRSSFEAVTVTRTVKKHGKMVTITSTGTEGAKQGEEYAMEVARQFPRGVVLIVVAGRNYAKYVAAKGYNVLDSAEQLARREAKTILQGLGI